MLHGTPTVAGRYSGSDTVELEGNVVGLSMVATMIDRAKESAQVLPLKTSGIRAEPYEGILTELVVEVQHDRPVLIRREGTVLRISGAAKKLALLAANIRFLAQQSGAATADGVQPHLHEEYYPDHPYLDSASASIVIGLV